MHTVWMSGIYDFFKGELSADSLDSRNIQFYR